MKFHSQLLFLTCFISFTLPLQATLEVGHSSTESSDNKAAVKLTIKNNFKQPLKAARAWVVMMDGDGKIVGQQAQWLSNPDKDKQSAPLAHETHMNLKEGEEIEATVLVKTSREAKDTKLTFSRIVLADGTLADPRKSLVKPKNKK